MSRSALWIAFAALALGGCNKAAPTPPPLPSASAAASAAPAAPSGDIPTPEDFEQEAIDQINPQNMAAEIDKLEKDIGP